MNIIISGGTGFIGRVLVKQLLAKGHHVAVLTRDPRAAKSIIHDYVDFIWWDGKDTDSWAGRLNGVDAVINLTGESIVKRRWSKKQKSRIVGSRIRATQAIVRAIEKVERRPSVLINASAVGYYGNVEEGDVTEAHPQGAGFLAETCEQWEIQARAVEKLGVRLVLMRTGVVLEEGGGAIEKILPPFRMFLGGPLGSGRQWFPWVHRTDVVHAILFALEHANIQGAINVAAPESVTMKQFCTTLGKVMGRPSWVPVPAFALRMVMGEMAGMLLTGQKAVPRKLQEAGFIFEYPKLQGALEAILKKQQLR